MALRSWREWFSCSFSGAYIPRAPPSLARCFSAMFAIASRCFAHVWLSSAFCLYISQSCGFLYLFPLARAFSHNWFAKTYIKHIFRQFVAGLSYIHSQGISHRDINQAREHCAHLGPPGQDHRHQAPSMRSPLPRTSTSTTPTPPRQTDNPDRRAHVHSHMYTYPYIHTPHIWPCSLNFIRRRFFNTFYLMHIILFVCVIIACLLHGASTVLVGVAFWGVDWAFR